jgi:fructose-bisphosphate aldolase/2-amino-3,7-dideoxy-D-threo-hept-6-ulosonate synthase
MDHGGYAGPIPGVESISQSIRKIVSGGADALLLQKGILKACSPDIFGSAGIIMRVSGAAEYLNEPFEEIVSGCEEAVRLGADAVAMTVYIHGPNDSRAFSLFGRLTDEADRLGMPVLGEFLPAKERQDLVWIKTAARIGAELGADLIKTCHAKPFKEIVESCPVPIVVLGGDKMNSVRDVLEVAYDSVRNGALGTCIGRNTFQQKDPVAMTRAISKIVHEQASVEEGLSIVGA